jgi:hypothetical protein
MTQDTARTVAFNPDAPEDERTDALAELHQSHSSSTALTPETLAGIFEAAEFNKSLSAIPHAGRNNHNDGGMRSVRLDDRQLGLQGDYWEKPAAMNFDALRAMVDQTPILNAVIMTRIRQVQRFCRVQEGGSGFGFTVRHVDKEHEITKTEQDSIKSLTKFMANCGWESNPRERKRLRRDSFATMMAKLTRDSLVLDSCAIETEFKRDRKLGMDGIAAIDGATIRLTPETGYRGDPDIVALQVVQGAIETTYTLDEIIYEARNPRSDLIYGGYGLSEAELMVRVVTGFLNAMNHNISGFDKNSIPKGVLHLSGTYSQEDLIAFRRYWNSMVKGVNQHWTVPVLVSKDQESKASFEKFGVDFDEMHFAKFMTFLTSIICAIYGMSPSEINSDSFSGGATSPLGGNDTAEKLADSKDKGLRPLLSYFENIFTDYIITDFSDKYVFRWTGLDDEDTELKEKRADLILTLNEMRAQEGYDKFKGPLGDAPLNPSLIGPWLQMQQPPEQGADVGDPNAQPHGGQGDDDEQQAEEAPEGFGEAESGGDFGGGGNDNDNNDQQVEDAPEEGKPFGKAYGNEEKADALGIGQGDEVFYSHPKHGLTSGKVLAHGKDGFTVEHKEGNLGVLWDGYHGHKKRKAHSYIPVEQGEDGMIAQDTLTGQHVYLHGELPDDGEEK